MLEVSADLEPQQPSRGKTRQQALEELARALPKIASNKDRAELIEAIRIVASNVKSASIAVVDDKQGAAEAKAALEDLAMFSRVMWPVIEPGQPLEWNWHLDEICAVLMAITKGEANPETGKPYDRVLINVPPGTTKSTLVSVLWPAWELARTPRMRYFKASYGEHLSLRDNARVLQIITSEWFQRHYNLMIRSASGRLFVTTDAGWSFATSVNGAGTGDHPDRIIIDDPITAMQAKSSVERERANQWFDSTVSTRGMTRNVAIVVIMQRLHMMDLTGHLLERGGWVHICFPMRFDAARADKRDHRTQHGELLWPKQFPEELVRKIEISLGAYDAAGQFQQLPSPQGGGMFKREWFTVVDSIPTNNGRPIRAKRTVRFWDCASTEGGGDYTAGCKISEYEDFFLIEDMIRGQWSPAQVDSIIVQTANVDGRHVKIREEREGGSSGKTVIQIRSGRLTGFDYSGTAATGSKEVRAGPLRAQSEFKRVKILQGAWNEAFLDELCVFPNGANDDQVDSASGAFNEIVSGPVAMRTSPAVWG